jgi:cell division protein FtsW
MKRPGKNPRHKKPRMEKLRLKKSEPVDFILFATVLLLVCIGVVMVFSASSYNSSNSSANNGMLYFKKQGLWAIIGLFCMLVAMKTDYHKLKRYTKLLMVFTVPLLCLVFAFPPINGARRWIQLGFASIQPSEIAKYTVVLYLAASLDKKGEKVKSLVYGVFPYLLVGGFYAGLVLAEKNLSIASVIMGVTLIMLFVAGARIKHLAGFVGLVGSLGIYFIFSVDYRLKRLMNFVDPWKDAQKEGFQLVQSLLALGSGGIFGEGFGQSRQKAFYIPEPHTDFIFAIIGEELGLIGCALIVLLFVILIQRGLTAASRAKDRFGRLMAVGITSVIGIQAIINMAVVTGSMPVTGVPLPFISYGGSSLTFNLIAAGVLLNISRHAPEPAEKEGNEDS